MRQAIVTKYHGPSNIKGARVSARAEAGSVMLHWDHALNPEDNHKAAAKALAAKFDWTGPWYGGVPHSISGFGGYCFVQADETAW